jgi:hypothetical protein
MAHCWLLPFLANETIRGQLHALQLKYRSLLGGYGQDWLITNTKLASQGILATSALCSSYPSHSSSRCDSAIWYLGLAYRSSSFCRAAGSDQRKQLYENYSIVRTCLPIKLARQIHVERCQLRMDAGPQSYHQ